jgi:hypothetical protein
VNLHPATLEVVRNALYAIAEEMSVIVMRSARSPLLKEAGDLSSALTDADGRLIAQGRDIPIHLGVMGFTVKEFLKRVPKDRLRDGDVWFLNLPEVGGNHLPDVKALRPVFVGGRLAAFAINLAHWADIGGAVPGSYVPWATESYQEGLRIAPIKLFSAEGPERPAIDFLLDRLRNNPRPLYGQPGTDWARVIFSARTVASRVPVLLDMQARLLGAPPAASVTRGYANYLNLHWSGREAMAGEEADGNQPAVSPFEIGLQSWQTYGLAGRDFPREPWLERWPGVVHATPTPRSGGGGWALVDSTGAMPLVVDRAIAALLAVSGGRPVVVAGEHRATGFAPLAVRAHDRTAALR